VGLLDERDRLEGSQQTAADDTGSPVPHNLKA
jgi:hypothetical protein